MTKLQRRIHGQSLNIEFEHEYLDDLMRVIDGKDRLSTKDDELDTHRFHHRSPSEAASGKLQFCFFYLNERGKRELAKKITTSTDRKAGPICNHGHHDSNIC